MDRHLPIPDNYQRVILINPTKYLGNFLIAGGLMQAFYAYCQDKGMAVRFVVDESFRCLIGPTLPDEALIYYPRKLIKSGTILEKIRAYSGCLSAIRKFRADLAFVVEEDTVAHRLTQFSGAKFKLGCTASRHKRGYQHVLPIDYEARPIERMHRWYSYLEVFQALGLPEQKPGYIDLQMDRPAEEKMQSWIASGLDADLPWIAIHAGATKDYKKWPTEFYIKLCELLIKDGFQPVLLGAGDSDVVTNQMIKQGLKQQNTKINCADLSNQMNLAELAEFMTTVKGVVGNDSGPFHLASALKVPGCTIYGPTEKELWGPLAKTSVVVQGEPYCVPECRQPECLFDHRCLKSVSPDRVFTTLKTLL